MADPQGKGGCLSVSSSVYCIDKVVPHPQAFSEPGKGQFGQSSGWKVGEDVCA